MVTNSNRYIYIYINTRLRYIIYVYIEYYKIKELLRFYVFLKQIERVITARHYHYDGKNCCCGKKLCFHM